MPFAQEVFHLGFCCMKRGKDGEDGLSAFEYLLVKHIVGIVERDETWCAEDDEDGVYTIESVLAIVDGDAELFGCSCGKDVDGIGDGCAGEEFRLQFLGGFTFNLGNVEPTFREGVGQHHAWTASMSDNGKVLEVLSSPLPTSPRRGGDGGMLVDGHEDAPYSGEFLT